MSEKEFWLLIRTAILQVLDALERKFDIHPRTSELRRQYYKNNITRDVNSTQ